MPPVLVVKSSGRTVRIPLSEGATVVGSSLSAGVKLPVRGVGPRHCVVHVKANGVFVEDGGTAVGSWLAGRRLVAGRLQSWPRGEAVQLGTAVVIEWDGREPARPASTTSPTRQCSACMQPIDPRLLACPFCGTPAAAGRPGRSQQARIASRWARLFASLLDGLVQVVASLLLVAIVALDVLRKPQDDYSTMLTLLSFLVPLLTVVLPVAVWQTTLGKAAFGLRVERQDGGPVGWRTSLGRAAFWPLAQMVSEALSGDDPIKLAVFVCGLNFLDVLFILGEERRCIHDYLAGTVVVRRS